MITIDEIANSLSKNENLSLELKNNILSLIELFSLNFPEVSLVNLKNRLATLKLENQNKYVSSEVSFYDPIANTLFINKEKLMEDADSKHLLMYELLSVITARDNYTGFNYNHRFEAMNIGYKEILTNFLVGNETESFVHADEIVITNLISISIGNEVLKQSFFENDYLKLTNLLIDFRNMIELMNYNVSREGMNKSLLADIESAYLKTLAGKDLTKEQIEQIESFLITNPQMMDHPEMYTGLETVGIKLELLKNDILSKQTSENYTL